ncbi:hypothetical protein GGR56DRAFT_630064 [Xylariaceae sp. FL0804]|nr:hypothetical protein GGR56DRAFT_630064 [Xylariaceae sp. FL0804]
MSTPAKRKPRVVSSCVPCYSRKQKCNRQYPCNHCTKRRRADECTYTSHSQHASLQSSNSAIGGGPALSSHTQAALSSGGSSASLGSPSLIARPTEDAGELRRYDTLGECFGFFEDGDSSTLGLLRSLGTTDVSVCREEEDIYLSPPTVKIVQQEFSVIHERPTIDFIIQYFFEEVSWMKQMVCRASFLNQYDRWWNERDEARVLDVEFAVLILRICAYTLQFLPSVSYTADTIRNTTLVEIRNQCLKSAHVLADICTQRDATGSVIRVQHLYFAALKLECDGRMRLAWATLATAIQTAQIIGLFMEPESTDRYGARNEFLKAKRNIVCNLYVWDANLSMFLNTPKLLSDNIPRSILTDSSIIASGRGDTIPDLFTERLLQMRLAEIWRKSKTSLPPGNNTIYDPHVAEEKFEALYNDFVHTLPAAFSLSPDKRWDPLLPELNRQREFLHSAIYCCICNNFKSALQMTPQQIAALPRYKQTILSEQRKLLARSALKMLESVFQLHSMFGLSQTRIFAITFFNFEGAVILAALCLFFAEKEKSEVGRSDSTHGSSLDLNSYVHTAELDPGYSTCLEASKEALRRLVMLGGSQPIAEVGARILRELLERIEGSSHVEQSGAAEPSYTSGSTSPSLVSAVDSGMGRSHEVPGPQFDESAAQYQHPPWLDPGLSNADFLWAPATHDAMEEFESMLPELQMDFSETF